MQDELFADTKNELVIEYETMLRIIFNIYSSYADYQNNKLYDCFIKHIPTANNYVTRDTIIAMVKADYSDNIDYFIKFRPQELFVAGSFGGLYGDSPIFDSEVIEVVLGKVLEVDEEEKIEAKVDKGVDLPCGEDLTEMEISIARIPKKKGGIKKAPKRHVVRRNPTIKEMQQSVNKWRLLKSRDLTFGKAAEIVGIPKKTLDDYYTQLKTGDTYRFPFANHLNDRIGVLRKFIKEHKHSKNAKKIFNVIKY